MAIMYNKSVRTKTSLLPCLMFTVIIIKDIYTQYKIYTNNLMDRYFASVVQQEHLDLK